MHIGPLYGVLEGAVFGRAWLTRNQDKAEGSWTAYSLNKDKENHTSPETALFMNDAATSYAVLSLTAANGR
jgi:hypothetical protein